MLEPVSAQDFARSERGLRAAADLKVLLDRYGSDKANHHNYHLVYGPILAETDKIRTVLEVGLGTNNEDVPSNMGDKGRPGASLRAFRDFLPNASVFGADVDRRILFEEDRIKTFYVDQTDIQSVSALARQVVGDLDLVIDDGLHSPNANIAVLTLAMSKLALGGWVVIEDISATALPVWQVVAQLMPDSYRTVLVDCDAGFMFAANRLH
jgi:hypothetical protein